MQIVFHGHYTAEEATVNLLSIIQLFKERYAISNYEELSIDFNLCDENGNNVELVDTVTLETLELFEIHKPSGSTKDKTPGVSLRLVVDNTK